MTFELYPLRFSFVALDSIFFPAGKPGNILRGAFGSIFKKIACTSECADARSCEMRSQCAYARIFEPSSQGDGPSGLADWPRPFVFRASHLDGCTVQPGEAFHFDLNLFEVRDPAIPYFVLTFTQLATEGLGPRRGRAKLSSVSRVDLSTPVLLDRPEPPLSLSLEPSGPPVSAIRIQFATPTELKSAHELAARPEFPVLFARVRDRISTLRSLYGAGPLDIDFRAMGELASAIKMTRCDLHQIEVTRRSARTAQIHSLGGFIGSADYEGDLTGFVPFLAAAYWTGVGRQTVWGKGQIRCEAL